jgi:hypothetical protein
MKSEKIALSQKFKFKFKLKKRGCYTYHLAAQGKFPKNMPLVSGGTSVRMMSLRLLIVIKA